MSHFMCHLSLFFFFLQSGEASRWRVCYHWCLPILVYLLARSKTNPPITDWTCSFAWNTVVKYCIKRKEKRINNKTHSVLAFYSNLSSRVFICFSFFQLCKKKDNNLILKINMKWLNPSMTHHITFKRIIEVKSTCTQDLTTQKNCAVSAKQANNSAWLFQNKCALPPKNFLKTKLPFSV